jgi:hypothetical protein
MSPLALFRVSTWFALFFIPVIPVSFKHYTVCPNCKRADQVSKVDIDRARAQESAIGSGHERTADASIQPATLERAVNEWASAAAHDASGASAPGPPPAPGSFALTDSPPPVPPAGWYPDPAGGPARRYWDGARWTEQTTPTPSPP